jgi:flagellin
MTLSVNTNSAVLAALQSLNSTNASMAQVQTEISTTQKVNSAEDDPSVWSIAQGKVADISSLDSVTMSLNRAGSIAQVALTAGTSVSDLLSQLRQTVVSATDPSEDSANMAALNSDYQSLLKNITQVVQGATFDGSNILNGSTATGLSFLASADGTGYVSLSGQDMTLGGSIITLGSTSSISTATAATNVLASLDVSLNNVNAALGDIGAQSNQIDAHTTFVSKLSDLLTTGVGNLVDADMGAEGARLTALQAAQQLGTQALSIANSSSSVILSLFNK